MLKIESMKGSISMRLARRPAAVAAIMSTALLIGACGLIGADSGDANAYFDGVRTAYAAGDTVEVQLVNDSDQNRVFKDDNWKEDWVVASESFSVK